MASREDTTGYFRRAGNRSGKRRWRGFYLGLLLLGINEHCTPGFAAEVSLLAAMLGSLAEARDVLAERGMSIDIKVIRRITYLSLSNSLIRKFLTLRDTRKSQFLPGLSDSLLPV